MTIDKATWDSSFSGGKDYTPLNQVFLATLLTQLERTPQHAVDLGCGTGDAAVKLAQRSIEVVGYDWSPVALKKARARAEEHNVSGLAKFIDGDIDSPEQFGLDPASMDLIICKLVIAFARDRRSLCEYVADTLTGKGAFIVITPVLHEGYEYTKEDKPGIAVPYTDILHELDQSFSQVHEFNHTYFGERMDVATFIARK